VITVQQEISRYTIDLLITSQSDITAQCFRLIYFEKEINVKPKQFLTYSTYFFPHNKHMIPKHVGVILLFGKQLHTFISQVKKICGVIVSLDIFSYTST
jgi:hypothetical protein